MKKYGIKGIDCVCKNCEPSLRIRRRSDAEIDEFDVSFFDADSDLYRSVKRFAEARFIKDLKKHFILVRGHKQHMDL